MVEENKPLGLRDTLPAAALLFFVWYLVLFPWIRYQFWQSDTWWLIETGRLILEKHCLPTHDPYSFTSVASHWTVYQWLTEVLFGFAHSLDGLAGVALLGGMLLAVLWFVLMYRRMVRTDTNPMVAAVALALCVYSYFPDFASLRPQLISFVLFWLVMVICADCKTGLAPWKALVQTFIIAVIWANCHISFPVAILLLTANFAGTIIQLLRKRCDKKKPLLFGALLATFLLGTFITPHGTSLWAFIGNTHNLYFTQEVGELHWNEQPLLLSTAIISWFSLFYLRKRHDSGDLLTMLGLVFVGTNCIRLIVYFCIYSCPVIGAAFSQLCQPLLNTKPNKTLSAALKSVALSKLYVVGVVLFTTIVVLRQPTAIPNNIPMKAAQYLKEHPIAGNVFCSAHAGSYLIYSSHGTIPVFMDTRVDLYDADFCKLFLKVLIKGEDWKEVFAKYKIAAALVPNDVKLRTVLDEQPDWKRVYTGDRYFTLFVPGVSPELF